jgi:hypothetical protein
MLSFVTVRAPAQVRSYLPYPFFIFSSVSAAQGLAVMCRPEGLVIVRLKLLFGGYVQAGRDGDCEAKFVVWRLCAGRKGW